MVITIGEMVEWSITAVLKTAVLRGTGGSNPSLSANRLQKDFTIVVILAFKIEIIVVKSKVLQRFFFVYTSIA